MTLFAEVAVNSEAPYRNAFTYRVPDDLALTAGQGVLVPFGPRTLQAVVLRLTETPSYSGSVRAITALAPDLPVVPERQLGLALWLAEQTLSPLFGCIALMLPPGAERRVRQRLVTAPPTTADGAERALDDDQQAIVDAVRAGAPLDPRRLREQVQVPGLKAKIEYLVREGLLHWEHDLAPVRMGPRLERRVRLLSECADTGSALAQRLATLESSTARQAQSLVARLQTAGGSLPLATLRRLPEWSKPLAAQLTAVGVIEETKGRVLRDPLADHAPVYAPAPQLTPAQQEAVRTILDGDGTGRPGVSLLHGVTGSGKTEVYLAAVAAVVARGGRVILLVPEISLTPQMIERFSGRFPGQVAVLHSGLSAGQRYDQWQAIAAGQYAIVIGSRSAIFAPVDNLRLIVLDEEHEWTYKQQEAQPRYHARDVAERLASLSGAALVLGSATPDVVSYQRALAGRYRLIELPQRIRALPGAGWQPERLPPVEVVDLARELREGNRGIFSRALLAALAQVLAAGEQAILFLNRRGSANFVLCRDCGHVPGCRRCAVSLTFHAARGRLVCHQCNRSRLAPSRCPRCQSGRIRYFGVGTQRVEEEVLKHFPSARVLRWDRDVAKRASDHAYIFEQLKRGEADVLVGTQMVAKSLDLPNITLVGVVSADLSLNVPEYRSGERAFQLLTQVAGRAGRHERPGRVILQTYAPNHYALAAAARHDYAAFFGKEIDFRRRGLYPPFARLARLVYAHTNRQKGEQEARRLVQVIRGAIGEKNLLASEVLGPAPCLVERLRGRWRWQLLLRCPAPAALLRDLMLPPGWSVDIDPLSFA